MEPEHIVIKEDSMKKSMPPPFPQALKGKKKASNLTEILEVLRQVDSCHGRVSDINNIFFLCSSYCRSQATAV